MEKYVVLEKKIGETPLQAIERFKTKGRSEVLSSSAEDFWLKMPFMQALRRKSRMSLYGVRKRATLSQEVANDFELTKNHDSLNSFSRKELKVPNERQTHQKYPPMAYAGRLDPMASGKLLILIGEECKRQTAYHGLDKEYEFSVLFGVSSDTGDMLGRLSASAPPRVPEIRLHEIAHDLKGDVTFPYPRFSSKTVKGKPLHVWTLEGRLEEIEIPSYTATIFSLSLTDFTFKTGADIANEALEKINSIPEVTEPSKALGSDFRRTDVREDWRRFKEECGAARFPIATFTCVSSSGLYMRTLAEEIAKRLGTKGLAFSIHRSKIGRYQPFFNWGFWSKSY